MGFKECEDPLIKGHEIRLKAPRAVKGEFLSGLFGLPQTFTGFPSGFLHRLTGKSITSKALQLFCLMWFIELDQKVM